MWDDHFDFVGGWNIWCTVVGTPVYVFFGYSTLQMWEEVVFPLVDVCDNMGYLGERLHIYICFSMIELEL